MCATDEQVPMYLSRLFTVVAAAKGGSSRCEAMAEEACGGSGEARVQNSG